MTVTAPSGLRRGCDFIMYRGTLRAATKVLATPGKGPDKGVEWLMMKHALVTTLFALSAITGHLSAQQAPPAELTEEALSTYTKAHVVLDSARDAFQREFGRTHDVQGQARLRTELAERIETILSEHGIPQEEYDRITAVISVDQALRERFEALLALLLAGAGAG